MGLKFWVGIWPGITVSYELEGLLSLGWQPSYEKENSDVKPG